MQTAAQAVEIMWKPCGNCLWLPLDTGAPQNIFPNCTSLAEITLTQKRDYQYEHYVSDLRCRLNSFTCGPDYRAILMSLEENSTKYFQFTCVLHKNRWRTAGDFRFASCNSILCVWRVELCLIYIYIYIYAIHLCLFGESSSAL